MKRRTWYYVIIAVLLAGGFVLLLYQEVTPATTNSISSAALAFTTSGTQTMTARYTVNSSPTGQWLVVKSGLSHFFRFGERHWCHTGLRLSCQPEPNLDRLRVFPEGRRR
jgi:hypothetical protein